GMIGVDHAQPVVSGEIDIKTLLILAEIRSPCAARIVMQRGGHRTPVDQVSRVPDQQAGRVVEAGVSEVEVVTDADGTCVGVVTAHDRVAVHARDGLREGQTGSTCNNQSSGDDRSIPDKAAACDHSGTSLSSRSCRSEAIFRLIGGGKEARKQGKYADAKFVSPYPADEDSPDVGYRQGWRGGPERPGRRWLNRLVPLR